MPVLTSPPLIGGAGKPVTGRVAVIPTATFQAGDGSIVTMAVQGGVIRGGQFYGLDGTSPLELIATPEGIGMRVVLHLDEQGASRGEHRVSRVVAVPDQPSVAWADLIDVVPPVSGGDYIVPPWAAGVLEARDETAALVADFAPYHRGPTPPLTDGQWLFIDPTYDPTSGAPLPVYTAPDGTTVEHGELVEWSA